MKSSTTTRVRGFAAWRPIARTEALLSTVLAILEEYTAYLPLTIRQIFYRLVGVHNYPKTERDYKNLGELINRARRAGRIDFAAIRDDGITKRTPHYWTDAAQLVRTFINLAEDFTLDRQHGQPRRLIFDVEAAGMVPLVEQVASSYGITVISSGGFDSTTAKYAMAQTLSQFEKAEVLHIGDHDPSGVHVFSSIAEDVRAFAAGLNGSALPVFTRLAVTPEQITELSLPTAPPKSNDHRSFEGSETTQVEAIPPDVLVAIITDAITSRLDRTAYDAVLAQEERTKAQLRRTLLPALRRIAT
jgi:hypothetical protein